MNLFTTDLSVNHTTKFMPVFFLDEIRWWLSRFTCGALLMISVVSATPAAFGQAPDAPPPTQVRMDIPEGGQCTTQIQYIGLEKALASGKKIVIAMAYPLSRTVATSNGQTRVATQMSDNREIRSYLVNGFVLTWDSKFGIGHEPATQDNTEIFKQAFPELDWVKPEYLVHKQTKETGGFLEWQQKEGTDVRRLLVDAKTLLPVSYEDRGGVLYRYSYKQISKELADLPPELAEALKRISKK